jgi:hypothetical protein
LLGSDGHLRGAAAGYPAVPGTAPRAGHQGRPERTAAVSASWTGRFLKSVVEVREVALAWRY